jgi:hypothetical protein
MAPAHEMADLALHLGPGCPVAGLPGRAGLGLAGGGQPGLVRADGDRAAMWRGGAPCCQRAGAAGRAEAGSPGMTSAAGADGRGDARGAGDGSGVQVDAEAVLGEVALRRGRRLGLDAGVQAGILHPFEELAPPNEASIDTACAEALSGRSQSTPRSDR